MDNKEGRGGKKLPKAVALRYDKSRDSAPVVTASGRGYLAEKIIQLARQHDVPLEENPVLAEALLKLDLGQEIPPELYEAVALILTYVLKTDEMLD